MPFLRSGGWRLAGALLAGTIATVPALREVIGRLLGAERSDLFDLTAALAVSSLVLLLHGRAGRREAANRALLIAHQRRAATEQSRIVPGIIALAGATDAAQLRVEAWRHVPTLTGGRAAWIAMPTPQDWQWVIEPDARSAATWLERLPVLRQALEAGTRRDQGWRFFPIGRQGQAQGLLAVEETPALTPTEEHRLDLLAVMLATAVTNVRHVEQLQLTTVSDALTGCFNRAHAFATLETELRRASRTGRLLSILMLDVDDFKQINDDHGHLCGDTVLEALGGLLRRTLRTSDVKCRYGGDEFLIILPETPAEGAEVVAEHLRRAVGRLVHSGRRGAFTIGVSVGVASAQPRETDVLALVTRADADLYRDKRERAASCARQVDEGGSAPSDAVQVAHAEVAPARA